MADNDGLLTFPCEINIKVVGLATDKFQLAVLTIIKRYFADLSETAIRERNSQNGKYLAMTITVSVQSKQQLDQFYQELSDCKHVIYTL